MGVLMCTTTGSRANKRVLGDVPPSSAVIVVFEAAMTCQDLSAFPPHEPSCLVITIHRVCFFRRACIGSERRLGPIDAIAVVSYCCAFLGPGASCTYVAGRDTT